MHIRPTYSWEDLLLASLSHPFPLFQPKDSEKQITYSILEQIIHLVIPQGSKNQTFEQWQLEDPEA